MNAKNEPLSALSAPATDHSETRVRIRAAIEGDLLQMVYQPIVNLRNGQTRGAEALARFQTTPYRTPDLWFAEAAAVGLGVELELKAVREALKCLDAMPPHTYLAVNVSPETLLDARLLDEIRPYRGARIVVELTEHARVENYEPLCEAIARLRSHHVRLSVDDAGAGFASFQHILQLRPDIIKLDRSLTTGVAGNPVRLALAAALVTFASSLGARICAEGIETVGDLVALQTLGIAKGQGYFFARPAPLPLAKIPEGVWMCEPRPRPQLKAASDPFRTMNGLDTTDMDAYLVSPAVRSPERLHALRDTALLDSPGEVEFDAITALAAHLLDAPIALVSLVDETRQYFKSSFGLAEAMRETPVVESFCRHAVTHQAPLIVEDAREHPLVSDSRLIREMGVLAYAGVPLTTEDRRTVGTLCAVDTKPRTWSPRQVELLSQLARAATGLIELHGALGRSRSRERLLEELFRQGPAAMFVCDIVGHIVRVNRAFLDLLGYPESEVLSKHIGILKHPDDAARDFAMRDELLSGRDIQPRLRTRYRRRDERWCSVTAEFSVIRGDANSALFTIGVLRED